MVSSAEGLQVVRVVYLLVGPPEQASLVLRRDVVYLACVTKAPCVLAQVAIALEDEQAQALPFVTIATLGWCAAQIVCDSEVLSSMFVATSTLNERRTAGLGAGLEGFAWHRLASMAFLARAGRILTRVVQDAAWTLPALSEPLPLLGRSSPLLR